MYMCQTVEEEVVVSLCLEQVYQPKQKEVGVKLQAVNAAC